MRLNAPRLRVAARLAGLVVAAGLAGCTYRTPAVHVPAAIPPIAPFEIDVAEVTVIDGEREADPEVVSEVRGYTAQILMKAAEERETVGRSVRGPTRVRVRVLLEERHGIDDAIYRDGIAVIAYLPALFGTYTGSERLSVDITLETGGRSFRGRGSAEKLGSLYVPARRRALAVALDNALADASASFNTSAQPPRGARR